ncbi:hypothetical protein DPMN_016018 [Dreissena polymorpha]|uniref:Uncharacterized protein n=1 Tax=Dreissena polymorpha TaxID=45954 RepID=A0A9D4NCD0_DREPO|nr:hypothetical protein DPMN_016018 [Dreissena polymorpha]
MPGASLVPYCVFTSAVPERALDLLSGACVVEVFLQILPANLLPVRAPVRAGKHELSAHTQVACLIFGYQSARGGNGIRSL